ncbi:MAG: hypothetical protein HN742_18130 [Lentisphaerae bacterium]|nr:hypothetical protein [Lentisphaerota bacterium]MBT4819319.1 hypothetical protein [Lentisphaerota bacterium]MBT5611823.1 hypothetical protein [Lentisphaerota bacterium]MBT7059280.1 hypothetical protein [Lentisphaerota bacterium]MBT7843803.1 hypothetical protein [Lentisphaerota bacterium]
MSSRDRDIVRELVREYMECCNRPEQGVCRDLWRQHNSLTRTRVPIYTRAFAWREVPQSACSCEDPLLRSYENQLRQKLYWVSCEDDSIFEPWLVLGASRPTPPGGAWGVPIRWIASDDPRGARQMDPSIKLPEDADRMVATVHAVDEEATQANLERLQEAVGDLIAIAVDRSPRYSVWEADISTRLAQLRGLDQVMWDMMDRPDWLHGVVTFMRDAILAAHEAAEAAGDWQLSNHQNQAMSYAEELDDPSPIDMPVSRGDLWCFCASQEFAMVGPELFQEFILQYQASIFKHFGLVAYGCCEDLGMIIPLLKNYPNIRRIAVSPMADVATCAEQIGTDYVLSYRPSPADMVSYDFNPERIRRILRRDLEICKANDAYVDITLKDVETVGGDPTRVPRWVQITREVIDEVYGA